MEKIKRNRKLCKPIQRIVETVLKKGWIWILLITVLAVFVAIFATIYNSYFVPFHSNIIIKILSVLLIFVLTAVSFAASLLFLFFSTHFLIIITNRFWDQLKSDPKSVCRYFTSFFRNNAVLFVLLLTYIVFYRFWENWLGNHIIDPFLSHFESNKLNDTIFITILIVCSVLVIYKAVVSFVLDRGKSIKQQTFIFSIIAIVVWAYYRFHGDLCGMSDSSYYMYLTPLSICNSIKYYDIVFVIAICKFISCCIWKYSYYATYQNFEFDNDLGLTRSLPISDEKDDIFGRDKLAVIVAKEIWETDTSKSSFTYSIDAPWGSGKTSFINLIKNHLKNHFGLNQHVIKNHIIIDFNPWLYAADKDLITAFFDEISKTLKPFNSSLAKNMIDYSKLLSAIDTDETKVISSLLGLIQQDNNSIQVKKQQISEAIKKINRKVFVFIDDLDRLEANEIMEMMKLIRNISDFPFMYIIAAYDKSYIVKCLSSKMKSSATDFIEKIFEHEDILTPCSNESLRRALVDQLEKIDKGHSLTLELENYIMDHNNKALNTISNLREVYRLANRFASTYRFTDLDADRIDLLLFELFKTKFTVAFSLFEYKWNEILVPDPNCQHYELYHGEDSCGHFDFILYLENHQDEMCLNVFDIDTIKMIFAELFGQKEVDGKRVFRINNIKWFHRFLNQTQLISDIPEKEFIAVMEKPLEEIKKQIDDWSVNKSFSLKFRLQNYGNNQSINHDQLENTIKGIIYYSSNNKDGWRYDEFTEIISHLKRFNDNTFSDNDKIMILNQLKENGSSEFIRKYLPYLLGKEDDRVSLSEQDIIEVQQSIFNGFCEESSNDMISVLSCFKSLYGYCLPERYNNYNSSLLSSLWNYIKDNIDDFIEYIMKTDDYWFIRLIWGSWDEFRSFLAAIDPEKINPKIKEFNEQWPTFTSLYDI